jgi:hypothetical protein
MFVLYELETGRAHSQSSQAIDNPDPDKWGVKETQNIGLWNPELLDFEPVPTRKRLTTLAFMELFTDAELVGILTAAKQSPQVELFVMKMNQAEFIDLSYPSTIAGINALASAGLLTESRANEVLNG